jgi:hypothetical protein
LKQEAPDDTITDTWTSSSPSDLISKTIFFHRPFDLTGERHVIILDVNPKKIENIFKQDQEIE